MLGFSTGQLLVILGACSVMMKPSDMMKIARTAGRMTGRAVGRLIVARRQLDDILGQSASTQVHKELKDAMTQLDTIRYEVQSLSRLTPGQFTMKQHNTVLFCAGMAEAGKSDTADGSVTKLEEFRHEIRNIIRDEIDSFYKTRPDSIKNFASTTEARKLDVADDPMALKCKDMKMANAGSTDLHSQAVTYARLSEAPGIKMSYSFSGNYQEQFKESNGLVNVLPISAESAGLLPNCPVLWWGAYGGLAYELQSLAKRIISLCCSASGCERNWSEFAAIHTKKRNRLEHQRLNKLVYVSYNRKMENRFANIRELGCKGKKSNPLVLEEFLWQNEWVEDCHEGDGDGANIWTAVDDAIGATQGLQGRNLPRIAAATSSQPQHTYVRTRKRPRNAATIDICDCEEDENGIDQPVQAESPRANEEGSESGGGEADGDADQFRLDEDLLL